MTGPFWKISVGAYFPVNTVFYVTDPLHSFRFLVSILSPLRISKGIALNKGKGHLLQGLLPLHDHTFILNDLGRISVESLSDNHCHQGVNFTINIKFHNRYIFQTHDVFFKFALFEKTFQMSYYMSLYTKINFFIYRIMDKFFNCHSANLKFV